MCIRDSKKILQQTRDIRTFSLTPEQYREFSRQAKDKVLFAGIQDKEQPDAPVDLVIPTTDLELPKRTDRQKASPALTRPISRCPGASC